ncbi:hypothetical protein [Dyadobacter psychrotolerans]|uniref:HEXXH motif domain-containing protein n=1 Tax=Dyadobacter psychrotolerans TaxID=2541721 RepID=A0A4R5DL41_9BACT|nr:hypothetical protein [Dyadobacter psychrotolerans]TDE12750.1 hypothetical protein E0F88_20585 [Dyadobacter psychrotolerans]
MDRLSWYKITHLRATNGALSDTIRMAFHKEDPKLFEQLDFEDDFTFLDPSLFCYFLSDISKTNKIPLLQSVVGYIPVEKRLAIISLSADRFGMINLPNLGYLRTEPNQTISIDVTNLSEQFIPNRFIENSQIRLCLHPTDLLGNQDNIQFHESIEITLNKNEESLFLATDFFQKELSDFWTIIKTVTREFVVFSSPNHNSFAGIMHHGTAYFNTENKVQTPVFFIDDIAHQCGHIIFNVLTLDTPKYLKVPKDHPLKKYSSNPGEMRGAYGAFHGLFTYTCILHALHHVFQSQHFSEIMRYEALGRIGFYMNKFYLDLKLMNNPEILTEEGLDFHRQFAEGFETMTERYGKEISQFDYRNQPYTFQYDLFQKLNPIPAKY